MNKDLERRAKESLIAKLENLSRLRAESEGRTFIPYSESFKEALADESYKTLKQDFLDARLKIRGF